MFLGMEAHLFTQQCMNIKCGLGIVLVLAFLFMSEMDVKQIITKIDVYSCGKCSIGKLRAFSREPNLIRAKGRFPE